MFKLLNYSLGSVKNWFCSLTQLVAQPSPSFQFFNHSQQTSSTSLTQHRFKQQNDQIYILKNLSKIAKTGNVNQAHLLFDKVKNNQTEIEPLFYCYLIKTYTHAINKEVHEEKVQKLYQSLQDSIITPHKFIYDHFIIYWGSIRKTDFAFQVFQTMQTKGIQPNTVTYSILIHQFIKNKQPKQAFNIFNLMIKNGIKPNQITYMHLIDLCIAQKKLNKATTFFMKGQLNKKITQHLKNNTLDCHGLSPGTACVMIKTHLQKNRDLQPFVIITGIGYHSKSNKKFIMQTVILDFLHSFYPQYSLYIKPCNLGRIYLNPRQQLNKTPKNS